MLRNTQKILSVVKDELLARRPLRPFALERFDGWNDSTLSLSSSECEPLLLSELLSHADDEGLERWEKLSLGYVEPSNGSEFLRREILEAQFDNDATKLDPTCVNVCAPQEAIFLARHALCQPRDHVVVVAPAYQSLHEVAASLGCQIDTWWPEEEETEIVSFDGQTTKTKSFRFRPETLQKLLRPDQTKLVVANFPHNPTGALPTRHEFQQMVDMISDCGSSWFLVDEMYRGLEHPKQNQLFVEPLPAVADCMDKGISLGGVSKSYGLPGLRVGWLVNRDAKFQKRVAELKDYTSICPPAPSEALAFIALRAQHALWQRSRNIVSHGLPLLRQFVTSHQSNHQHHHQDIRLEWFEPLGGTFAWVRFKHKNNQLANTASQYCDAVRQRTGLMMIPSALFPECQETDDSIRLTYGRKGMEQLLELWKSDMMNSSQN